MEQTIPIGYVWNLLESWSQGAAGSTSERGFGLKLLVSHWMHPPHTKLVQPVGPGSQALEFSACKHLVLQQVIGNLRGALLLHQSTRLGAFLRFPHERVDVLTSSKRGHSLLGCWKSCVDRAFGDWPVRSYLADDAVDVGVSANECFARSTYHIYKAFRA